MQWKNRREGFNIPAKCRPEFDLIAYKSITQVKWGIRKSIVKKGKNST